MIVIIFIVNEYFQIDVIFINEIMIFWVVIKNLYIMCNKIENLVYLNLVVIIINKIVFL